MHPLLVLAIVFIIIGIFLWVLPVPSPAPVPVIGMYLFFIGVICLVIWAILLAVGTIAK